MSCLKKDDIDHGITPQYCIFWISSNASHQKIALWLCLAAAYFLSISCATSCRRSPYAQRSEGGRAEPERGNQLNVNSRERPGKDGRLSASCIMPCCEECHMCCNRNPPPLLSPPMTQFYSSSGTETSWREATQCLRCEGQTSNDTDIRKYRNLQISR